MLYMSSRVFENMPQKGPEYVYRNLAMALLIRSQEESHLRGRVGKR